MLLKAAIVASKLSLKSPQDNNVIN